MSTRYFSCWFGVISPAMVFSISLLPENLIYFYSQIQFQCVQVPHFHYPFIYRQTIRLLPFSYYLKKSVLIRQIYFFMKFMTISANQSKVSVWCLITSETSMFPSPRLTGQGGRQTDNCKKQKLGHTGMKHCLLNRRELRH